MDSLIKKLPLEIVILIYSFDPQSREKLKIITNGILVHHHRRSSIRYLHDLAYVKCYECGKDIQKNHENLKKIKFSNGRVYDFCNWSCKSNWLVSNRSSIMNDVLHDVVYVECCECGENIQRNHENLKKVKFSNGVVKHFCNWLCEQDGLHEFRRSKNHHLCKDVRILN
jgi:hypothetical protein